MTQKSSPHGLGILLSLVSVFEMISPTVLGHVMVSNGLEMVPGCRQKFWIEPRGAQFLVHWSVGRLVLLLHFMGDFLHMKSTLSVAPSLTADLLGKRWISMDRIPRFHIVEMEMENAYFSEAQKQYKNVESHNRADYT